MKFEISLWSFEESSNTKFHEKPFNGSRVILYRQTDSQPARQTDRQTDRKTDRKTDRQTDRQTYGQRDMAKQVVALRNFADAPKVAPLTSVELSSKNFDVSSPGIRWI